jgi:D-alanyl-D-alanine carboxypeptidase/D-alanyl-D-alanine-endopeptidase (penicillin-binding protein 4)
MKRTVFALACLLVSLAALAPESKPKSLAAAKKQAASLNDSIKRLLARPELKGATVGVHVVSLSDGKTRFAHEADRLLIPASNVKLFTTAAALSTLGADFEFRTVVGTAGRDLVVVGAGDPTIGGRFTDGDPTTYFRRWARVLKDQQLTRVAGDLVLDDSYFDRQFVHPGWPKGDLGHWYAAPVAALVLNDSCIDIRVAPASTPGQAAQVSLVPRTQYFEINNRTRAVKTSKEHAPRVLRASSSRIIQCDGGVFERAQPLTTWLPVDDPVQFFGTVLREVLAEEGIAIDGRVLRSGDAAQRTDFQPRLVHRFALLPVLEVTNKDSQNLYAEQILKTLGAVRHQGSWESGRRVVKNALLQLSLEEKSFVIDDGCGLSRSNRASPRAFTSLLTAMHRAPYSEEYRNTLSVSGVDGTLKKRLKDEPYRGRVWAKTGSISGVRAITGYAKVQSGEWLAFSFIANNVRYSIRNVQDDFCKTLVDWNEPRAVVRHGGSNK